MCLLTLCVCVRYVCAAGVTWEELLTFLLQKNQAGDEGDNNRFLRDFEQPTPPTGASHSQPMSHLIRMSDKDKYLSIGRDATLRIWQTGTPHLTRVITMPEKCWINAVAYCTSNHRLALATAHSKLLIYDTNAFQRPQVCNLPRSPTLPRPSMTFSHMCLVYDTNAFAACVAPPDRRHRPVCRRAA